jgi:hypothetical protein
MAALVKPKISKDRLLGIQIHRTFFTTIQEQGPIGIFLGDSDPAGFTGGVVETRHDSVFPDLSRAFLIFPAYLFDFGLGRCYHNPFRAVREPENN